MLTLRLILAIAKYLALIQKAIDFVLAFKKSELEGYIWMQLTIRFQGDGQTESDPDKQYVLE